MLYTEGNLCAEDRALRHIARGKVHSALTQVEAKQTRLVDRLVETINVRPGQQLTAEQLLDWVENHVSLRPEHALINRYTNAFPELTEPVTSARARVLRTLHRRLQESLAPLDYQRRFAHTLGLRRHG